MTVIDKCALACVREGRLLLVMKKGLDKWILPGGKRDGAESDEECVRREVREELGVSIDNLEFLGEFEDGAYRSYKKLVIRLFAGDIVGEPQAQREIEKFAWFSADDDEGELTPIIRNKVLPFLREKGLLK